MEVYRYRRQGRAQAKVSKSVTTLPALVVLSLGLLIVIVAIILFAAYGIPRSNVKNNLKALSGPIVLAIGLATFLGGIAYGIHLKNKEKRRIKEEKAQQHVKNQQAQRITLQQKHQVSPPANVDVIQDVT